MNIMNSRVGEIHEFIKTNVLTATDHKKGEQVVFANKLPSQAIVSPKNLGQSSS